MNEVGGGQGFSSPWPELLMRNNNVQSDKVRTYVYLPFTSNQHKVHRTKAEIPHSPSEAAIATSSGCTARGAWTANNNAKEKKMGRGRMKRE